MTAKEEKAYGWIRVEAPVKARLGRFCSENKPEGVKRFGQGKGIMVLLDFYEQHQGGRGAL